MEKYIFSFSLKRLQTNPVCPGAAEQLCLGGVCIVATVTTGLVGDQEPPRRDAAGRDAAGRAPGERWDPLG